MSDYRIFFLRADGSIDARHDFRAPDDVAALQIMAVIGEASADEHHGLMLWAGTRRLFETHETPAADGGGSRFRGLSDVLAEDTQRRVLENEEALLDSHWRLAKSRRLLEATDNFRRELRARKAS